MVGLMGYPVDERVKLMTALLVNGVSAQVDHTIDRMSGSELKEFASCCIRLLAESRTELAHVKGL